MGSAPGPEGVPYAVEQLSPCTHNCWSLVALEPVLCDKRSHCNEVLPTATRVCSVTQSCLTLCSPMDCSTPGFPVHHQLLELTQTHVPTCHIRESPCSNEDPVQPINKYIVIRKKKEKIGFPGGSVVKNLPAHAGDMVSIPDLGRSHMLQSNWARVPQLLSLCSRAWDLQLLSPCAATTEDSVPQSPRSAVREATAMRSLCTVTKDKPYLPQLEKSCRSHKDRAQPKIDK